MSGKADLFLCRTFRTALASVREVVHRGRLDEADGNEKENLYFPENQVPC